MALIIHLQGKSYFCFLNIPDLIKQQNRKILKSLTDI